MHKIILFLITAAPGLVFAASTIEGTLTTINNNVLKPIIPFLTSIALVVFVWGVVKYIRSAGEEDVSEAKRFIVYGLIGLFIMSSVWGLVKIISDTMSVPQEGIPTEIGKFK